MTCREAIIQALVETGLSRETAELKAKMSNGVLPEAGALVAEAPVRPGLERTFIESLKLLFRHLATHPQAVQQLLQGAMQKQTRNN